MEFLAYLKTLKRYWPHVMQAASAVSITIAGFVKPPTYFDPVATVSQTRRFAVFAVAILILVFFYFAYRWSLRKHGKAWAIITVLLLVAMAASELVFREIRASCICQYDGKPVLTGTQFTTLGKNDLEKKPGGIAPCEDLLMDFQGKTNLIWTTQSINTCRRSMLIAYWFTFSIAGLTVLSALQITRALRQKDLSKKATRRS